MKSLSSSLHVLLKHGSHRFHSVNLRGTQTWSLPAPYKVSRRSFQNAAGSASTAGGHFLRLLVLPAAGVTVGTVAYGASSGRSADEEVSDVAVDNVSVPFRELPALQQLLNKVGVIEVVPYSELPFVKGQHMFAALVKNGLLKDISCFYKHQDRVFHCVVRLGSEVCGYPSVVHGGLTAAIIDESFGGLLVALRKHNVVPFWRPAYTAQLEVSYKKKVPNKRVVVCSSEVESLEGRKVWMRAVLRDAHSGQEYAVARALFVSPSLQRMGGDALKSVRAWLGQRAPES